ncbi:MAG: hypothetical protein JXR95_11730, partial [Deltaproteobacteria bacterium]|nr:hypothetical protein [Deltaproteobacteria bacterium]
SLVLISVSGCDDSTSALPLGSACDETSNCQGVCNLALPDGMCVEACSNELPCGEGICVQYSDTLSYCMPECAANEECREGYTCLGGFCRPPTEMGSPCEEVEDCEASENVDCKEGICSIPCTSGDECGDAVCALTDDGEYWCLPVDFPVGDGTFGYPCAVVDCAEDFTCLGAGSDDAQSYCTKECTVQRDCPPDFICRDAGEGDSYCIKRATCEECDLDYQCGFQTDKCVLSDPSVSEGSKYCSVECDPDRVSCPLDFTCMDAYFCPGMNAWVPDCTWCTTGDCEETPSTNQCFHDYGACTGTGELCTPCRIDDDCTEGLCLEFREFDNKVCSRDCSDTGSCPDGFACYDFGSVGAYCMPRTESCTDPSGDQEMCEGCGDYSDCLRGDCIPLTGSTDDPTFCLNNCSTNEDCPDYSVCDTISYYGYTFHVCVPETGIDTCEDFINCSTACPNGPTDCPDGPAYCVD